jgi:hypothetical protein
MVPRDFQGRPCHPGSGRLEVRQSRGRYGSRRPHDGGDLQYRGGFGADHNRPDKDEIYEQTAYSTASDALRSTAASTIGRLATPIAMMRPATRR